MRVKIYWKKLFALACLLVCAGVEGGSAATEPEPKPEQGIASSPDWMKTGKSGELEQRSTRDRHSVWRSTGALLIVIGGLMAVQITLRRRAGRPAMDGEARLNVVSRLRVGARQELMVVDWEGDRFILGVGPSFIQPVHHQKKAE